MRDTLLLIRTLIVSVCALRAMFIVQRPAVASEPRPRPRQALRAAVVAVQEYTQQTCGALSQSGAPDTPRKTQTTHTHIRERAGVSLVTHPNNSRP
jgi:hypothetical protein